MKDLTIAATALLLGAAAACTHALAQPDSSADESTLLRDWALARCLGRIQSTEDSREDAYRTASAYLERTSAPLETYEKIDALVATFASKPYSGSIPGSFNTMKCIDLYHSEALEDIVTATSRGEAK